MFCGSRRLPAAGTQTSKSHRSPCPYINSDAPPIPPIPFELTPFVRKAGGAEGVKLILDGSHYPNQASYSESKNSSSWNKPQTGEIYSKLSKEDAGYGGSRTGTPPPGEGLLARRLRGSQCVQEAARQDTDDL